jgi:arsenate reductase-like glutaredoxin family protein
MVHIVRNFFANRYIENEFIDYKSDKIVSQLTEIYNDLGLAYKRRDKTTLSRSLSESMRDYTFSLLKEDMGNPFLQKVTYLRPV